MSKKKQPQTKKTSLSGAEEIIPDQNQQELGETVSTISLKFDSKK